MIIITDDIDREGDISMTPLPAIETDADEALIGEMDYLGHIDLTGDSDPDDAEKLRMDIDEICYGMVI